VGMILQFFIELVSVVRGHLKFFTDFEILNRYFNHHTMHISPCHRIPSQSMFAISLVMAPACEMWSSSNHFMITKLGSNWCLELQQQIFSNIGRSLILAPTLVLGEQQHIIRTSRTPHLRSVIQ
jgi:hypothetical protein